MKRDIVAWALGIVPFFGYSQSSSYSLKDGGVYLQTVADEKLQAMHSALDTNCDYSCLFIKFKLSKNGEVSGIETSGQSKDATRQFFVNLVQASSGHWTDLSDLPDTGRYLLLPCVFSLTDSKCKVRAYVFESVVSMLQFGVTYDPSKPAFFHYKPSSPFDGIILNPVLLYGMSEGPNRFLHYKPTGTQN